jgi:hypothetical protein
MATLNVGGSALGTRLQSLLLCEDLAPGSDPSYQLCKTIYSYHPLGKKMADTPIAMAMSQQRELAVPDGPEDRVRDEFVKHWKLLGVDKHIFNTMRLSRIYGIASVTILADDVEAERPVEYERLPKMRLSFNVLDPLNTAGSLVLDQDPNSPDFQKAQAITVQGKRYHRSRSCTVLNEDPLYIEYTVSAFGFVGRSVYQRALFPLKSFVQTMITDDMVSRKAGLLIAFMKGAGSIVDRIMANVAGLKRALLQSGATNNVLSMDVDEKVDSLNLQNIDGASKQARMNILENIASSADMPAKLLNAETFAEGFGEGSEDAKHVASYIDGVRLQMQPLYDFFDPIVMHRAWTPAFYKTVQRDFPEYNDVDFAEAFQRWKNSFSAIWPSLLTEPDSEKIKVDDVKLKAVIALLEVLAPMVDPRSKAELLKWAADNINENEMMFQAPLVLDYEAIAEWGEEQSQKAPGGEDDEEGGDKDDVKLGRADSARVDRALGALSAAVARLPERSRPRAAPLAIAHSRRAA